MLQLPSLTHTFSSKSQSSMTTFHHKLLTREGKGFGRWTNPSIMHDTICALIHKKCHPRSSHSEGHFTKEIDSPWPLHFKHSHWWNRSKFASHYAWGTNGVSMWMQDGCKIYMDSYMASNGSCFVAMWIFSFQKPPLGGRPNTKPGDHDTPNACNHWFILFYHMWGSAWTWIHQNSIRLKVRSQMSSHYTWKPVTTLHEFGGVLGRPLDTFFGALRISWSRLLARVWSGPWHIKSLIKYHMTLLNISGWNSLK